MINSQSYARTSFTLNSTLNNYTIEFWYRPYQGYSDDAYLMSLYGYTGRTYILYTTITLGSDKVMYCTPNPSINTKLRYLDFN
jgi:hypothetical protein